MSVQVARAGNSAKRKNAFTDVSLLTTAVAVAGLLLLLTGFRGQPTSAATIEHTFSRVAFEPEPRDAIAAEFALSVEEPSAAETPFLASAAGDAGSDDGIAARETPSLDSRGPDPAAEARAAAPSLQEEPQTTARESAVRGSATVVSAAETATVAEPRDSSGSGAFVTLNPLESGMLAAINARRIAAGLKPVAIDPVLTEVSRTRSQDMVSRNYFSHTTPDGTTFVQALLDNGVDTGTVGEILGRNNAGDDASVGMVVEAFTKSPSHNLHLVYQSYEWAGIGVAVGPDAMKYYTIIFRAPV